MTTCTATKQDGAPCRARPQPGSTFCPWHDPDPEARERHRAASRRGGEAKAYGALAAVAPIQDDLGPGVDLGTAQGGRDLLAVALQRLAALPFDVRIAHALAQLVAIQRAQIETSDLEQRLAALEASAPQRPGGAT